MILASKPENLYSSGLNNKNFFEMHISSYLDIPVVEIHGTLYACVIRAATVFPLLAYKIKVHCTIDKSFIC